MPLDWSAVDLAGVLVAAPFAGMLLGSLVAFAQTWLR